VTKLFDFRNNAWSKTENQRRDENGCRISIASDYGLMLERAGQGGNARTADNRQV
jgi:hypothetical protein